MIEKRPTWTFSLRRNKSEEESASLFLAHKFDFVCRFRKEQQLRDLEQEIERERQAGDDLIDNLARETKFLTPKKNECNRFRSLKIETVTQNSKQGTEDFKRRSIGSSKNWINCWRRQKRWKR